MFHELHVEGWTGWGRLKACEFDDFTSAVQLGLHRLYYHTTLSAQREDGLRNWKMLQHEHCHRGKITERGYTDVALVSC